MRRVLGGIVAAALAVAAGVALSAPASVTAQGGESFRVGVAVKDASWRVGASAGQYAGAPEDPPPSQEQPTGNVANFVDHESNTFDPTGLSTRRYPSYGLQSRLSVRAIVVDGPNPGTGDRFAIVKNDQYIPQDLVIRRAGQILEQDCPTCGIQFGHVTPGSPDVFTPGNLFMTATHDHSSPMYSSTSWGVWAFQDVFDIRFFEYLAQNMADAVEEAVTGLTPATVAVRSTSFDKTHRHSFGPARADDGTPAGYPQDDQDHDLTVVRFDKTSGEPLANLVNYSQHPEMLEGNDLISADYVAPFERMLDRETGAVTVYNQGSVGTSEDERSSFHNMHERLEFPHRDYAQAEWGARLMANAAKDSWDKIGSDTPAGAGEKYVPKSAFTASPDVGVADRWFPGPFSHPYPGVSNCRVDSSPGIPVVGLPDCEDLPFGVQDALDQIPVPAPVTDQIGPLDPGLGITRLRQLFPGIPTNYSAPAYTGLEEDIDVHLQAVRIGPLFLPMCSCEQWWDQSRNIELRTDKVIGNEDGSLDSLGYDWGARCVANPDGSHPTNDDGTIPGTGTWDCPNSTPPVTNAEYQAMRAQVNNPANGWNDAANAGSAEGEPTNPEQIKGNYTHDDRCGATPLTAGDSDTACTTATSASASLGYDLTVPISMTNDYNGYIASYREYRRGDHYRKALTGWGPHSSDYMSSRLVSLGRQLKNPLYVRPTDEVEEDLLQPKVIADLQNNDARAAALGTAADAYLDGYEAALPADGGNEEILQQPEDIERFDAALIEWNGGSNFTDNPMVKVQRQVGANWVDYADQSGELPVTLEFPSVQNGAAPYTQGNQQWHWTARFEAFVAGSEDDPIDTGHLTAGDQIPETPAGNYRFIVTGERREGQPASRTSYSLTSEEFEVKPWEGILPQQFRLESGGEMSFRVGPRSPFTHPVAACRTDGVADEIGPVDYPDTHERANDPAPFIRLQRTQINDGTCNPDAIEWYCFTCTWRPWLDFSDADTAKVTVTLGNHENEVVNAARQGDRWVTSRKLRQNETAQVLTGNVLDPYGNTNQLSAILDCSDMPGACAAADADGDGVLDSAPDNCPFISNPAQTDTDHDGTGDACDVLTDSDGDGVGDATDQCPGVPGNPPTGCPPPPLDTDGDGVPDTADDCPTVAGVPGPPGSNGCPAPSPTDGDGDGVPDSADQCPSQPGPIDAFGCPAASSSPPPATGNCGTLQAGTKGNDSLLGTAAGDFLRGLRGGDRISGGDGPDCVFGGPGKDRLDGQGGDDLVRGGDGPDRVKGSDGNDEVSGGRGRDRLSGGAGDDSLRSVDGDVDRLDCGPGNDRARIGDGDRARNCERVRRVKTH